MAPLLGRSKSLRSKAILKESPQLGNQDLPTIDQHPPNPDRARTPKSSRSPEPAAESSRFATRHELPRPRTSSDVMSNRIKGHISFTAEEETYRFPTPVSRTFASNSLVADPSLHVDRSGTPDTIGLAIGSPSHAPPHCQIFPSPLPLATAGTVATPPTTSLSIDTLRRDHEQRHMKLPGAEINDSTRPKLSRWRSLGGFFGGKKSSSTGERSISQSLQTRPAFDGPLVGTEDWPSRSAAGTPPMLTEVPSIGTHKRKKKGPRGIKRAATLPVMVQDYDSEPSSKPLPLLEVTIPDIQMERYSVMFNGLLPHQGVSPQPSNLLARRQANSEKASTLRPLDLDPQSGSVRPRRRATSPEPTASPSMRLMLFPPDSSRGQQVNRSGSLMNRPRPLRRTRTAPGALSPSPSVEDRGQLSPMYESEELAYSSHQVQTPTPSTPSQPATPRDERPRAAANGKPSTWKYTLVEEEPTWEMLTMRSRSDSRDSDAFHITEAPHIRPSEAECQYTAEVSVARSLSVIRPRMQLLRPVRVENERLIERKALTPTLVDVRNRKSVAVQIEGA